MIPVHYLPFRTDPEDWRRRMEDLRFRFGKWDLNVAGKATVPPGALVLDRREVAEVAAVAEDLYAASLEAQRAWHGGGGPTLPGPVEPLAAAAPPGPFVTRVDLFPTADGWRASECNDDVPGGYNEAIGLPLVCWDLIEDGLDVPGDLPQALARLVCAGGGTVGITYATGYAEDLEVAQMLARWFETLGCVTVLGSPGHFTFEGGTARLDGTVVDRVFRFFPVEWHAALPRPARSAWTEAARAGFQIINPFAVARTQDKASFAHLRPAGAARAAVPRTRMLDGAAREALLAQPERWVLKPRFGRMGAGVVRGVDCDPATWRKRVDEAWRVRGGADYVCQERFHVLPVEVGPGVARTPCVGAYVVDGTFAGCYTRLAERGVVGYDAANVLTLAEGA